jgi:hypothetical protein
MSVAGQIRPLAGAREDHRMLNESLMRAVVAEKARQRDDLVNVRRLRATAVAGSDGRLFHLFDSLRARWRRAGRRAAPTALPEPRPRLRVMCDDVFAP